jgi:DMSO/TMAO reductase YedYZ molybdopterin-dependent catalytic subunit
MSDVKRVEGIKWGDGTLLNAKWSGYRVRDIINAVGIREEDKEKTLHICFAAEDAPTEAEPWYGASVPVDLTLESERCALLATHVRSRVASFIRYRPLTNCYC